MYIKWSDKKSKILLCILLVIFFAIAIGIMIALLHSSDPEKDFLKGIKIQTDKEKVDAAFGEPLSYDKRSGVTLYQYEYQNCLYDATIRYSPTETVLEISIDASENNPQKIQKEIYGDQITYFNKRFGMCNNNSDDLLQLYNWSHHTTSVDYFISLGYDNVTNQLSCFIKRK